MSIEVINEALELLRLTQNNMGPDREWLPSEEQAHWDRVSKCMEGLEKLRQQEPVAWSCDGGGEEADEDWATHDHSNVRRHIKSGGKCIELYAAPVPAAVPEGWKLVPVEATEAMESAGADALDDKDADTSLRADAANTYRAMLSAAPAAPAVTADVATDAERYRWLKGQHENNGEWHVKGSPSWIPMPLDAAIDDAMQKGSEQ